MRRTTSSCSAVRLSAQCTDERVNQVTPALFARFPTLESFAEADPAEVERIHPLLRLLPRQGPGPGRLRPAAASSDFGGRVPGTMEELHEPARRGTEDGEPYPGGRLSTSPPTSATPTASASRGGWGSRTAPRTRCRWSGSSGRILPPEEISATSATGWCSLAGTSAPPAPPSARPAPSGPTAPPPRRRNRYPSAGNVPA